jgi:hypothetical protein
MPRTPYEKRADAFNAVQDAAEAKAKVAADREFTRSLEAIRARVESPEYQEALRARLRDDERRKAREARDELERRLGRLPRAHVGFVRKHCDPGLQPLDPVPDIWAQLRDRWDGEESVFLLGPTDTQKTTTAVWAAMRWAETGRDVWHTTALRVCRESYETVKVYQDVSLLILDELHRLQGMPPWQVGPAVDLIDRRYGEGLTTIACGTVSPEKMTAVLGEEVRRRFGLRLATTADRKPVKTGGQQNGE